MVVPELRRELEAQGLPTDGNRNVLYQRVQKARRINLSRGRPLWIPPVEQVEEEVDEEVEELISRIQLQEGNTEFWKRRFLGEDLHNEQKKLLSLKHTKGDDADESDKADEEEEVEQSGSPESKDKEVEDSKAPLQMIGVQLSKDDDMAPRRSKKNKRKFIFPEKEDDEDWFPLDIFEAFKEMRERKAFDVEDMYTIADAWGWTWDVEIRNRSPQLWSPQWEVDLAIKVMLKVMELGGTPTIGDCAMILRSAIKGLVPSSFLTILQITHKLGYKFGSPLYDEVITLCLDLKELDAAIAIVADLETGGITVSDEILDKVISTRSDA